MWWHRETTVHAACAVQIYTTFTLRNPPVSRFVVHDNAIVTTRVMLLLTGIYGIPQKRLDMHHQVSRLSNNKASVLAYLAGVERDWKVHLSRLTKFFPNGFLCKAQECVIDTCHMFLYILCWCKSALQADKGFVCLFSLSGFKIRLRKSFLIKFAIKTSAVLCR